MRNKEPHFLAWHLKNPTGMTQVEFSFPGSIRVHLEVRVHACNGAVAHLGFASASLLGSAALLLPSQHDPVLCQSYSTSTFYPVPVTLWFKQCFPSHFSQHLPPHSSPRPSPAHRTLPMAPCVGGTAPLQYCPPACEPDPTRAASAERCGLGVNPSNMLKRGLWGM